MNNTSYLDQLNEQQRAAVTYCDGPQLVIAGAGSGKTRVLTYKIVHLLHHGLEPYRIMALTFTNKAAREMRERITTLVGHDTAAQLWMGTFHSIFARILRVNSERIGYRHDFTIYDSADSRSLIKMIVKDLGLDEKVYIPNLLQARISEMKNNLVLPEMYADDRNLREQDRIAQRPRIADIYATYCRRCRVAGAMDFDDLLMLTNVLLRDNDDICQIYRQRFGYLLVDEYQDTNFAQHRIVLQLSRDTNRVCLVGDDAQSIYSFRGANIGNILNLRKHYPDLKVFKLERNYRSTQTITEAANSLIEHNRDQYVKHLYSENPVGSLVAVVQCFNDYEEAYVVANQIAAMKARQGDSYNDFAILYRTNAQSRVLEEALSNGGRRDKHGNIRDAIPYRIYGGLSFYNRKEVKDTLAYLRLASNPDDDEALRRVINYPARGIGETTVARLQHAALTAKVSLWAVVSNPKQYQLPVNAGALRKIEAFAELINGLAALVAQQADAYTVAQAAVERAQLITVLRAERTPENISRQENITELLTAVNLFVQSKREAGDNNLLLPDFLAEAALLTDQDTDNTDNQGAAVTLMTIHAAKGLEFKNVFIVGVEDDLIPSAMSSDTLQGIEEERRLLYVAITRAMSNCVMTFANSRFRNGTTLLCRPSRFLREIAPQYLQQRNTGSEQSKPAPQRRIMWNDRPATTPATITSRSGAPAAPRPSTPAQTTPSTGGNFTHHTIDELSVGTVIVHSVFGRGIVTALEPAANADKITVTFNTTGQTKTIMLRFALFSIEDSNT